MSECLQWCRGLWIDDEDVPKNFAHLKTLWTICTAIFSFSSSDALTSDDIKFPELGSPSISILRSSMSRSVICFRNSTVA
jgi:hypothetical protein